MLGIFEPFQVPAGPMPLPGCPHRSGAFIPQPVNELAHHKPGTPRHTHRDEMLSLTARKSFSSIPGEFPTGRVFQCLLPMEAPHPLSLASIDISIYFSTAIQGLMESVNSWPSTFLRASLPPGWCCNEGLEGPLTPCSSAGSEGSHRRALWARRTGLICSPSTPSTNFTGDWESNENSLPCMFI